MTAYDEGRPDREVKARRRGDEGKSRGEEGLRVFCDGTKMRRYRKVSETTLSRFPPPFHFLNADWLISLFSNEVFRTAVSLSREKNYKRGRPTTSTATMMGQGVCTGFGSMIIPSKSCTKPTAEAVNSLCSNLRQALFSNTIVGSRIT